MFAILTLLACGDDTTTDSGTTDSGTTDTVTVPESHVPAEGDWTPSEDQTVVSDECGLMGDTDTSTDTGPASTETWTLASTGEDTFTFTLTDDEITSTWNCTQTGNDFACDEAVIDLLDNQTPAINLDVAWSISGTFASDTEITGGGATGEFRCEGDGCDLILSDTGMSFPCGFEIADVSWTHAG